MKVHCIQGTAITELPESNIRGEDHEEGPSSSPLKKCKIVLMHKKAEEALEQCYEEVLSTLVKALTEGAEWLLQGLETVANRLDNVVEEVYHIGQVQVEQTRLLHLIAEQMLQDPEEAEEQGQGSEEAVNQMEMNADLEET